jgi:catechol 2,3-dioxygenase-like lactoylglutathione lyase family enzyme
MITVASTILYCSQWDETVRFYRDRLNLSVTFSSDWFVEFSLNATSRLSIADERRASVKSAHGKGITLSWKVDQIDTCWAELQQDGLKPTEIHSHSWGARHFFIVDPEKNRIEFWQSND